MKYYLVTWNANWADEMNINGFIILDEKSLNDYKSELFEMEDIEISIGTNEYINYTNGQNLFDKLTIKELTDKEKDIIQTVIGNEFGFTEFYHQILEEDDEDSW